jgi:non-specific serine/threonine protein kinase
VVKRLRGSFDDGAQVVALAAITDAAEVAPAIARALDLRLTGPGTPDEQLLRILVSRHMLLVLDNLEQIEGVATVVSELVDSCDALRLLLTSRERLRLAGEHEYPVPPLSLAPADTVGEIAFMSDAVRLFVQRAEAARPGVRADLRDRPQRRRDLREPRRPAAGIELAAARVKLLTPGALRTRLQRGCPPDRRRPDQPERQRTLRDAIAWSYDLMTAEEQATFRRLSVFVDGFAVEQVEAVCAPTPGIDMLDVISALVDKSLVTPRDPRR